MKKITFNLFVIIFTILCLSACNKHDVNSKPIHSDDAGQEDTEVPIIDDTGHIVHKLSSGVVVDAPINILQSIDINRLSTYKAELIVQDYDKAKQLLLKDKEIIEEEFVEKVAASQTNSPYQYSVTKDNFIVSTVGQDIYFGGELESKINNLFVDRGYYKNSTKFLTGEDLSFQSIKDAQIEVQDIINNLGITVSNEPICYTLDYDSLYSESVALNEYINEINATSAIKNDLISIEKKDECYLFVYQVLADGAPLSIYENGIFGIGSFTTGTTVRVLYSIDGIVQFNINYQYKVTDTISQEKGITIEEVLNKLDKKYHSMILEGEYTVYNIEFEYVPMPYRGTSKSFTLIPAWRCSVVQTFQSLDSEQTGEFDSLINDYTVLINAITGEEIPLNNSGAN